MTGPIHAGDDARFRLFLLDSPSDQRIAAFAPDSGGGNLLEAERMAARLRSGGANVVVRDRTICASACFLLFAAGKHRFAYPAAYIGVHSAASSDGSEDENALAATTLMARDAAELGVPASIIGKLVTTQSHAMAWLHADDMSAISVVVLSAEAGPAPTPISTEASAAAIPPGPEPSVPRSAAAQASLSEAFADGRRDRLAWEAWFNGLPNGLFRGGAHWWSAKRSKPRPASCISDSSEWTNGCNAARDKLAADDVRRTTEPNYRLGWNSL